jgi:NAD(P)-dependent dehydrogenase (short-subunit alcohol dehydrogenase family)
VATLFPNNFTCVKEYGYLPSRGASTATISPADLEDGLSINGRWLVTGVSSGLGRDIARAALEAGFRVIGTVRKAADAVAFEALSPGRAIGFLLDVSDHDAISGAVDGLEREIGPIEVVVNNAGYGHEGPVESVSVADFRKLFDANFFGTVAVCQAVLPHMRRRGAGRIINVSSFTAVAAPAGLSCYASSKAAMNCLSECLAKEVEPLGIKVTNIICGSFRTKWAGDALARESHPAYAHLEPLSQARRARDGAQTGDPRRFAAIVLRMAAMEDPPIHLIISPNVVRAWRDRSALMLEQVARFEDLAMATDFD